MNMSFEKVLYKYEDVHGPGDVYFIWQKGDNGSLLATTGSDGAVAIFNRQGQMIEKIILSGLCTGFAWDNDGTFLGIITAASPSILIWDSFSQKKTSIETGLRDPLSCIVWSRQKLIIAVGTVRGNLSLCNYKNGKRTPILGKHNKRITCGTWSAQNLLALGSDDKSFSISSEEGDSIRVVQLRDVPSDMFFSEMGSEEDRTNGENAISMIIGKRTLFIYNMLDTDSPIELGFQSRYGSLLQHKWFGDGFILLGFSNGHVVAISTHPKDIGQELWQVKNHKEMLTGLAHCPVLDIVASCGDDTIKIHSITNLQETEKIISVPDHSGIQMIDWSSDGQLLGVSTSSGSVYIYVTKLKTLYSVAPPRIAMLCSLTDVSIYVYAGNKLKPVPQRIRVEVEPEFLSVGPFHLACGVDQHVWFYDLQKSLGEQPELLIEKDMPSKIRDIKLNADYFAVLCSNQLIIQAIVTDNSNLKDNHFQSFPNSLPSLCDAAINCFTLTMQYLVFATDLGHAVLFSVDKWDVCSIYRHNMGIRKIFSDTDGTKIIFIDDHGQGYVLISALEEIILIHDFPKNCEVCLWDLTLPNVFYTCDLKIISTHIFVRYSIHGKHTQKVGETKLNPSQIPVMVSDSEMVLHIDGGQYATQTLSTHLITAGSCSISTLKTLLLLRRYNEAYAICKKLDTRTAWLELGKNALSDLETTIALRAYRSIKDIAMAKALEEIRYFEDINILSGFCCVLLEKYDEAEEYFLKGSYTKEALDVCRDLLQWEKALLLAQKFEPKAVPFLAREYGQQLEFSGNYSDALYHYEKGYKEDLIGNANDVKNVKLSPEFEQHIKLCKMGIARTSIRGGDFRRGIQYAVDLNDSQLLFECAELLAAVGHITEAAGLYERGAFYDEACALYISLKMWNKANQILSEVKNTKLHSIYAKSKENDGQFLDAINSYRIAGDLDACVRLYLDHLCDPHSASEIVLESRSVEAAKMLSKFYQKIGDIDQALQYLVLCGCIEESFIIAHKHNKLKLHGELLERYENGKPSDYLALAQYFESEKHTLFAGKYYFLGREFTKALRFLLRASSFVSDESEAISMAIECVASSNNEQLASQLIEFLLGEVDGSPRDPRHLFRLYMARKQYKDAAKTAVIIANQEQLAGNYKAARDLLFSMYQELRRNNLSVTSEMRQNLILLHRYTLVRIHIKLGNHLLAAKLLIIVAEHISQFPEHIVPILTSTVIECHRAGLKKSAFMYASLLMRPDYRNQLDARYIKKIELIVRKTPKGVKNFRDEIEDEAMECPICGTNLPNMEITCFNCKTTLPICIATGQHIIKTQMTSCPECDFPCFRAEMEKILSETSECPMCGEKVRAEQLLDVEDVRPYILAAS